MSHVQELVKQERRWSNVKALAITLIGCFSVALVSYAGKQKISEHQTTIAELKEENTELKEKLDRLKTENAKLTTKRFQAEIVDSYEIGKRDGLETNFGFRDTAFTTSLQSDDGPVEIDGKPVRYWGVSSVYPPRILLNIGVTPDSQFKEVELEPSGSDVKVFELGGHKLQVVHATTENLQYFTTKIAK